MSTQLTIASSPSQPQSVALWGIPGVGKTQIALEFANVNCSTYPFVQFVRSDTPEILLAEYTALAESLNLLRDIATQPNKSTIIRKVNNWLKTAPKWLLIFDNVPDLTEVRQFVPMQGAGHILFTTRNKDAAEYLVQDDHHALEVKSLPPDLAAHLVLRILQIPSTNQPATAAATALADILQGLPIAVDQAATLARRSGRPLQQLVDDLKQERQKILDQPNSTSFQHEQLSTWALLNITMRTVEAENAEAIALFRVLVYLETSSIPISIFEVGGTELVEYFERADTYDRGALRPDHELKIRQESRAAAVALSAASSRKRTWSRRPKPGPPTSLRADSAHDKAVLEHLKTSRPYHDVLTQPVLLDHAITYLIKSGLVRKVSNKTLWVHDLFRDIALEMLSKDLATQRVAHLTLVTVYLAFPTPPESMHYFRIRDKLLSYLPHALVVLRHCRPFVFDTSAGPELMHIVASTYRQKGEDFGSPEHTIAKYWLFEAFKGYVSNWKRLQGVYTDNVIISEARSDFALEPVGDASGRIQYTYERLGTQAPRRALDTLLKLSYEEMVLKKDRPLGLKWAQAARRGYAVLLGPDSLLTEAASRQEQRLLQFLRLNEEGLSQAIQRVRDFGEYWGENKMACIHGWGLTNDVAMFYEQMQDFNLATDWYTVTLDRVQFAYGDTDPLVEGRFKDLARVCASAHWHERAVYYASRAFEAEVRNQVREIEILGCYPEPWVVEKARCAIAVQQFEMGDVTRAERLAREVLVEMQEGYLRTEVSLTKECMNREPVMRAVWLLACLGIVDADVLGGGREDDEYLVLLEVTTSTFGALRNGCCHVESVERLPPALCDVGGLLS